jgi:formate hydrogenlyase subunit 3/multisubunit Na+/H+ antiporter MnhD subunit
MTYLFAPFVIFQLFPAAALLPAAGLLALLLTRKNKLQRSSVVPACLTALCWVGYGYWEYRVKIWALTEIAPIRVDLLLIYPVLAIMTFWSLIVLYRHGTKWQRGKPE